MRERSSGAIQGLKRLARSERVRDQNAGRSNSNSAHVSILAAKTPSKSNGIARYENEVTGHVPAQIEPSGPCDEGET